MLAGSSRVGTTPGAARQTLRELVVVLEASALERKRTLLRTHWCADSHAVGVCLLR